MYDIAAVWKNFFEDIQLVWFAPIWNGDACTREKVSF